MTTVRISIEANIGGGKSDFINSILKPRILDSHVEYKNHSLSSWRQQGLLKDFYENTSRWSYYVESRAIGEKIATYRSNKPLCILHRSWMTNRFVFSESIRQMNCLTEFERNTLNNNFNLMVQQAEPINYIIYLRTLPDTCYANIQRRNREEEIGLSYDYIQNIHNNLEEWLDAAAASNEDMETSLEEEDSCKVIIIEDFRDISRTLNTLREQIPELRQYIRSF